MEPRLENHDPNIGREFFRNTPMELLSQFLRGELAASATYEQALHHVDAADVRVALERCRQSHADRAVAIAQTIRRRGGYPPRSAGVWGAFTKAVERGAAFFGDDAIAKTLYAGEVNGLDSYTAGIVGLDDESRDEVGRRLIRAQRETLRLMEPFAQDDTNHDTNHS